MKDLKIEIGPLSGLTSDERIQLEIFLYECKDVTIFHTLEWQEILQKWLGKKIFKLTVKKDHHLIGLMFFERTERFFLKYSYSPVAHMGYGGPLILEDNDKNQLLSWVLTHLISNKEYYSITFASQTKFNKFLSKDLELIGNKTSIINLTKSEDELFSNFSKSCRNGIRKAEKNGLIVEFHTHEFPEEFLSILRIMSKSKGLKIKKGEFYREIFNSFSSHGSFVCLAKYNRKYVAGAFILCYNRTAYYWLGCSLTEYNNLSPNNIIQWEIIKKLRERSIIRYDMLNLSIPSIARFKSSFGGTDMEYDTVVLRSSAGKIFNQAKKLWSN
jgi:hypothetical protein